MEKGIFIWEAFIEGIGTVRACINCQVLVAGGPTRCNACAEKMLVEENSTVVGRFFQWLLNKLERL